MGETENHKLAIFRISDILSRHFEGQPVHVTGDLLLFYEEGNPKKFVVPDVFVVKTFRKVRRRNFKIWEEEGVPNVVIEVTSKKTRKRDQVEKPALYRALGIREYFLFDPLGEYLDNPLMGFRLVDGVYQRIPHDAGALMSEELGLQLRVEEDLEFFVPATGERLLDRREALEKQTRLSLQAQARADQEQARADEEQARAEAARQRAAELAAQLEEKAALIAQLEVELARLRAQQPISS